MAVQEVASRHDRLALRLDLEQFNSAIGSGDERPALSPFAKDLRGLALLSVVLCNSDDFEPFDIVIRVSFESNP